MRSSGSVVAGTKVDVYFLPDSTGSMASQLDSVKKNASLIMEKVRAMGADVQFGVGNYKDFDDEGSTAFDPQQSVTADRGSIIAAINSWQASGGGENDIPEAQLYALDQLATGGKAIGWRPEAQHIVVWFGDAPGHDPICKAISGLSYDITEESVTEKLKRAGVQVIALSTPSGLDHDPRESAPGYVAQCGAPGGRSGQAIRITTTTGGSHISNVNTDVIAATIIERVHVQISDAPGRGLHLNAWGWNTKSELSDSTTKPQEATPVTVHVSVPSNTYFTAIDAGGNLYSGGGHSLGLDANGNVYAWGWNNVHQLGNRSQSNPAIPDKVSDLKNIKAIAAGGGHSLALDANGNVYAWGWNNVWQLGDDTNLSWRATPKLVPGLANIKAINAGQGHSLVIAN